jgi:hypothetical protein
VKDSSHDYLTPTAEFALDVKEPRAIGILAEIRRVNSDELLPEVEQWRPLHIHDVFAAREGNDIALDLQNIAAIDGFDSKRIAREGKHFLFDDELFVVLGDELRENSDRAHGGWGGGGGGHCDCDGM